MHVPKGTLVTAAGACALVLGGGPMLAKPAQAAAPNVLVRPGDTLSSIAERSGVSLGRLIALNHLSNPDLLLPGQRLVLGPASTAPSAPSSGGRHPSVTVRIHVVDYGENLTGVARRYGTSVAAIVAANHLANANRILAGQRLRVPVRATAGAARSSGSGIRTTTYRVRAGETLTAVAVRYNTTVAALTLLNSLANPSLIQAGRVLRVPIPARSAAGANARSAARFPADTRAVMARRTAVRDLIIAEARRAGVPVGFALAVAWQESGWRQSVVSNAGAVGVMQLLPPTADWIGQAMLHATVNVWNRRQNVRAGVTLLKHYLLRYKGNRRLALAAYYQGQRSADRHGVLPVSHPYVASILLLEELLEP